MIRHWRWLRWFISIFLLLLVLPLLLLASERGSTWLMHQAAGMAPAQGYTLQFKQLRGNLLGRVQLSDVSFAGEGVSFNAKQLSIKWQPKALLDGRIHVLNAIVMDARLVPPQQTNDKPAEAMVIPNIALPLELQFDNLQLTRFVVVTEGGDQMIEHFSLGAHMHTQQLTLSDLQLRAKGIDLNAVLSMQTAAPQHIKGSANLSIARSISGEQLGDIRGTLQLSGKALQPQIELQLKTPAKMQLQGAFDLREAEPGVDLQVLWEKLPWPLRGESEYISQQGVLRLRGKPNEYQLQLRTQLRGGQIPTADINLRANGDLQGLRLAPLEIKTLQGSLVNKGALSWSETLNWNLQLQADTINPGDYLPDWPGLVSGRVGLSGRYDAANDQLSLLANVESLTGILRDQPLSLAGRLSVQNSQWRVQKVYLISGPNQIQLNGHAGKQLDLDFSIDAPDLALSYPALRGQVFGAGRLEGTRLAPVVVARLKGKHIGFEQLQANELGVDINWRNEGGKGQLRAEGLMFDGTEIAELITDLQGTPEWHDLTLQAKSPHFSLDFKAQGGVIEQKWQGDLQNLVLSEPQLGRWQLKDPAKLQLGQTLLSTSRLCLQKEISKLCAEGKWRKKSGLNFRGNLTQIDMAMINLFLSEAAIFKGRLEGDFALTGKPDKPNLIIALKPGDGLIQVDTGEQERLDVLYRNADIKVNFADDHGEALVSFELEPNGRAKGRLQLGVEKAGSRSLGGAVNAEFPDLALLAGFVPILQDVKGRLHLDAKLAGTLQAPRVLGSLQVTDASARLVDAGLELHEIDLLLRGDGEGPLSIKGQAYSGKGQVELTGSIDPAGKGGIAMNLHLLGNNFLAFRSPEASVFVSPDLRIVGAKQLKLSGTLTIPRAEIELKEVPVGTVSVSDDEVVVGETIETPRKAQNINAKVRVVLGDKVKFKGFGLKTDLTGALDTRVDTGGTRVDGKVELRNATYKAYGQDLTVERGRILFAGAPGNPDVDLRAMRLSIDGQVKAYLAMSGALSKPQPRVYSDPVLPEAEAVAYLLTGKGLSEAGKGEGIDIASAALSLGLAKGEPLLQDMSERLGLDDLRVEGGGQGLENTSLILGKYLSPDLYLGYSQGLFNPEGAALLKLRLNKNVEVETRSGIEQSVDVFYRREYD